MQQAEDRQRLIVNPVNNELASVRADYLEQGHDCPHARAVDQTQTGEIDNHLRRSLFAHLGDYWSELDNGECVQLTFDPEDGNSILCVEMKEHAIFR